MAATTTGDDLYRTHSAARASRIAFGALLLRDLVVLRKNLRGFIPRTIIQPLLLCFVFLYVFPTIGTGVGGGRGGITESDFATILVAGVVGLTVMFQGIQAVALPMVQEFGYTKEIEDRVLAPLPVMMVAIEKVVFGALQGLLAATIVFPIAAVVHADSIHIDLQVHWLVLITLIPLACITCSALGLTFGTIFEPRNVPLMFGIVILPLTFLGGTYYAWTTLEPVKFDGLPWLQYLVLINPLVYINEGSRAALTSSNHMSLWAVYPALIAFSVLFLWVGTRNFARRVIT
jgi:ABC-2 type transport system permease protein